MDNSRKPDETLALVEYVISNSFGTNIKRQLSVRFVQWIYRSSKTVKVNRIELRLVRGSDKDYFLSLTIKAWRWFIECLRTDFAKKNIHENGEKLKCSIYEDNNIYFYNKLDDSITQLSVYSKNTTKCFGMGLTEMEKEVILQFGDKIKLLTYFNLEDDYDEIFKALFISILARNIIKQMKLECKGCKSKENPHSCVEYFRNVPLKFEMMVCELEHQSNEIEFKEKLETISRLLRLKNKPDYKRIISNLKAETDKTLSFLQNFIDFKASENYNFDEFFELIKN